MVSGTENIALEVKGLSKSFGGVKAVSDVHFNVRQGELLALIGPNGAGKTTCFNMLNGQLRPNAGSVIFDGRWPYLSDHGDLPDDDRT